MEDNRKEIAVILPELSESPAEWSSISASVPSGVLRVEILLEFDVTNNAIDDERRFENFGIDNVQLTTEGLCTARSKQEMTQ